MAGGLAGGRRPARGSPPVPPPCPAAPAAAAPRHRDGALRLQAPPIGGPPPRLPHQHYMRCAPMRSSSPSYAAGLPLQQVYTVKFC